VSCEVDGVERAVVLQNRAAHPIDAAAKIVRTPGRDPHRQTGSHNCRCSPGHEAEVFARKQRSHIRASTELSRASGIGTVS
jgi:hypothetical protein